jgi:hypothetical protein
MERRREVRERLTGLMERVRVMPWEAAGVMEELGVPVYVVWRTPDHGGQGADESLMARSRDMFEIAWNNDEATVFRLK